MVKRSRNNIAIPPGATIKDHLNERGMSQKEFALRMNMSEKHISRLINGDVQLTVETAIKIETVLGIPARFFINLESIYREKLQRVEEEQRMDVDKELARYFPYNEMAKKNWVPETKSLNDKVLNLRKFFGVVELALIEKTLTTKIACRRLAITEKSDSTLVAWIQAVKNIAKNINTDSLDLEKLKVYIPIIRKMTTNDPEVSSQKLKKLLSDCGIALVFLPHLDGSFLQGASFIDGNKIIIGMTARGRYADKFWFSLFHELAHIVLGHLSKLEEICIDDENNADIWASNILIPSEKLNCFVSKKDFSKQGIEKFALELEIDRSIVVGRLQNDGVIGFDKHNNLKKKYVIK